MLKDEVKAGTTEAKSEGTGKTPDAPTGDGGAGNMVGQQPTHRQLTTEEAERVKAEIEAERARRRQAEIEWARRNCAQGFIAAALSDSGAVVLVEEIDEKKAKRIVNNALALANQLYPEEAPAA